MLDLIRDHMFCTSLRRRSSFASVIPRLTGAGNLGLRESQLSTHDLTIPITTNIDPRTGIVIAARQLRVLLFSPSSNKAEKLPGTMERIKRFASLTGGQDLAIVFLLAPPTEVSSTTMSAVHDDAGGWQTNEQGVIAYSGLQATMMDHADIPHVPILPLTELEGLPGLLKKHLAHLRQPPQPTKPPTTAFALLQLCTARPPMSQQTAYILSDLFPNLRELAETCTSVSSLPSSSSPSVRAARFSSQVNGTQDSDDQAVSKLRRLRDLVGEQECADIIDFWKEEWVID